MRYIEGFEVARRRFYLIECVDRVISGVVEVANVAAKVSYNVTVPLPELVDSV